MRAKLRVATAEVQYSSYKAMINFKDTLSAFIQLN